MGLIQPMALKSLTPVHQNVLYF
uniref:Uncharacterized protein n=1 Tax=Anguilla anguilla TaxID=7936 RepID=A0A0E9VJ66_ANGAN